MGTTGEVITEMDLSIMAEGQKAGLCSMGGKVTNLVGIMKKEGALHIFTENNGKVTNEKIIKSKKIFLKAQLDIKNDRNRFSYSTDNKTFNPIGENFTTAAGYWKGTRVGLFSFNEKDDAGSAAFNWFTYSYDGPKQ